MRKSQNVKNRPGRLSVGALALPILTRAAKIQDYRASIFGNWRIIDAINNRDMPAPLI
jgi:hypothetical protein